MIIEMTQDGDGAWLYHDNTQAQICLTVMALTGWEITGFDDWINTDSHWADTEFQGKENRNELIKLRHRLTKTFHDYNGDNYVIQLEAERLFAVAQWIATHIAGYKVARKDKNRRDKAVEVSKLPRPNAVSPLRKAIIEVMHQHKKDCQDFKSFVAMWELGHLNGLTIQTFDHIEYVITDENSDMGCKTYTFGSLSTMYSQAI